MIFGITFGISNQNIMNYTLKKNETNRKTGKFFYEVIDESGNVISTRSSNREYVACTIHGGFYFGRIDLIGKGDHGRMLKHYLECINLDENTFNKRLSNYWESFDAYKNKQKENFANFNSIAYLK